MEKLRLAIQKSGRLSEKSRQMLAECGISFQNGSQMLVSPALDFPLELLFLRDDDIPQYVEDGVADIGIVGLNEIREQNKNVEERYAMGFARCRLCMALPKDREYTGPQYFSGKKIATSYPVILQQWLTENDVQADIHQISGSVEIAPAIGLAEAIFDIVSSGSTLISNGLKEVATVMKSEAMLIATPGLSAEKEAILLQLLFRIEAVRKAENNKYILLNAPNNKLQEIIDILPGMKSPTVMPLSDAGWSSLHSVVRESEFWSIINQLKAAGAQGILVIPIEKMIL